MEEPVGHQEVVNTHAVHAVDVGLVIGAVARRVGVGAIDIDVAELDLESLGSRRTRTAAAGWRNRSRLLDSSCRLRGRWAARIGCFGLLHGSSRPGRSHRCTLGPAAASDGEVVTFDNPRCGLVLELNAKGVVDPVK